MKFGPGFLPIKFPKEFLSGFFLLLFLAEISARSSRSISQAKSHPDFPPFLLPPLIPKFYPSLGRGKIQFYFGSEAGVRVGSIFCSVSFSMGSSCFPLAEIFPIVFVTEIPSENFELKLHQWGEQQIQTNPLQHFMYYCINTNGRGIQIGSYQNATLCKKENKKFRWKLRRQGGSQE